MPHPDHVIRIHLNALATAATATDPADLEALRTAIGRGRSRTAPDLLVADIREFVRTL